MYVNPAVGEEVGYPGAIEVRALDGTREIVVGKVNVVRRNLEVVNEHVRNRPRF